MIKPNNISEKSRVCRCLFGRPEPDTMQNEQKQLRQEIMDGIENAKRKWNYDFQEDKPMQGRYAWSASSSSEVPSFYSNVCYNKQERLARLNPYHNKSSEVTSESSDNLYYSGPAQDGAKSAAPSSTAESSSNICSKSSVNLTTSSAATQTSRPGFSETRSTATSDAPLHGDTNSAVVRDIFSKVCIEDSIQGTDMKIKEIDSVSNRDSLLFNVPSSSTTSQELSSSRPPKDIAESAKTQRAIQESTPLKQSAITDFMKSSKRKAVSQLTQSTKSQKHSWF